MNQRVLPVIAQALLLATTATAVRAQSQSSNRVDDLHARSSRLVSQLSTNALASSQFGLSGVMRQYWDGSGWMAQSQTTHTYTGVIRYETIDYEWNFHWQPTFRTIYRSDGLVDYAEQWDVIGNKFGPGERYYYEFEYVFPIGQREVSRILAQQWNGVAWENSTRTTNTIVPGGSKGLLIVGALTETWTGSSWMAFDDFSIVQVGDDVVQTSRLWDEAEGKWHNWERTTFHSDTIPGLYEKLDRLVGDFANFGDLTIGLLMAPDHSMENWSEDVGEWEPVSRKITEAFHWTTGKPAVIVYESWNGAGWTEELRQEIQYTPEGRALKSEGLFGFGEGFVETYEYDDLGNMKQAVNSIMDSGETFAFARFLLGWVNLSTGTDGPGEVPYVHNLNPAYPNPFNPSTTLAFEMGGTDRVKIAVYDILGKQVATLLDELRPAGKHEVVFDANGLPSGLYTVRMETAKATQSRTVTLIK